MIQSATTYYIPTHPSYYPGCEFSQEQLERALAKYVQLTGLDVGPPKEVDDLSYVIVREPGKFAGVVFDRTKFSPERNADIDKLTPQEQAEAMSTMHRLHREGLENIKTSILQIAIGS